MGFGLGIALLVIGLIFALAINADAPGIDITTLGWILVLGGIIVIVATAVQANARRRATAVRTVTHPDGTQTRVVRESEIDPPPPAI